jgi:hypothetical protein
MQHWPIRQSEGWSEPSATTGERGSVGNRGSVEGARGDRCPSAETFLEAPLEVEPVSHR